VRINGRNWLRIASSSVGIFDGTKRHNNNALDNNNKTLANISNLQVLKEYQTIHE